MDTMTLDRHRDTPWASRSIFLLYTRLSRNFSFSTLGVSYPRENCPFVKTNHPTHHPVHPVKCRLKRIFPGSLVLRRTLLCLFYTSHYTNLLGSRRVLHETLRLFPSANGIPKISAEDTTLTVGGSLGHKLTVPVPRGTFLFIDTPGLHYNRTSHHFSLSKVRSV